MTEDKKTKYVIGVSVRVGAQPEGTYSSREVVNTTRQNETQELDAIPAAAFHAAKEAVQGALIGMGTNPARIGLELPGMLEEPEALPEGPAEAHLPEGWEATLENAIALMRDETWDNTADGLEGILEALRTQEGVEPAKPVRDGDWGDEEDEEPEEDEEDDLGARPMGSPIT